MRDMLTVCSARFCLFGLLVTLWVSDGLGAEDRRPNIVFMMADDMGVGNVSSYGTDDVLTPHIDRLAEEGIRFTDAHAPSAVCQPTRYAILSGRGYWRNRWGRIQAGTYFRENEVLLPRVLQSAGYATAMFGKWHLGHGWAEARGERVNWNKPLTHGPNWAGFDYWFGMANSHAQPPYVWIENDGVYKHDPTDPMEIITHAEAAERGIQVRPDLPRWGVSVGAQAAHDALEMARLDLELAERANRWIAERDPDQPFFLYVPFFAPHVPLAVAEEFRGSSPLAKRLGRSNNNAVRHADYCQQLDHAVGMILDALDAYGFADNTLVIFSSDNGAMNYADAQNLGFRSNGPFLGGKTQTWEGGHRVPFLARWPGRIPEGAVSDHLISLTDLYDTFMAVAGVDMPAGAGTDGLNILPMWTDPADTSPIRRGMEYKGRDMGVRVGDWVFLPHQGAGGLASPGAPSRRLGFTNSDYDEDNQLKPDAPPAQLYNLAEDFSQTTNLYHAEAALREELEAMWDAYNRASHAHWHTEREKRNQQPLHDFYELLSEEAKARLWPAERWE